MRFKVNGVETYASTGGRKHEAGKPWIVFIHGAGSNHLAWLLQTRSMAYDGYNVLAPDLPGHNLSAGEAIPGVAAEAEWLLAAMDAAGCAKAVLCGHSQGGLVAMEVARQAPERVQGIVFVATAAAIPVNPSLIETAQTAEPKAFEAMTAWAHGPEAHMGDNTWPGGSHIFFGIDAMGLNRQGALASDLQSCASYDGGFETAASLKCPTLCVFAKLDRMTPLKSGMKLAEVLPANELLVIEDCGHTIPTERPRELTAALRRFLAERVEA